MSTVGAAGTPPGAWDASVARSLAILFGAGVIVACAAARPSGLRVSAARQVIAHQAGVYLTAADFDAGHVADALACESDSRPVGRDASSAAASMSWPSDIPAKQYRKAEIFGFRACDGTDVRFVGSANFTVVHAPPLYLYRHEYQVRRGKGGSLPAADHAFSTTSADSVRPLTLEALKRAYPSNHRFHDLLDLAFRDDEDLMRYDEFHQEYRVARLLRQSQEQPHATTH